MLRASYWLITVTPSINLRIHVQIGPTAVVCAVVIQLHQFVPSNRIAEAKGRRRAYTHAGHNI